jgi:secreted trypsin-like serine protease
VITRPKSTVVLAGVLAGILAALPGAAPAGAHDASRTHRLGRPHGVSAHAAVIGGSVAQPGAFPSVVDIIDIHGREGAQCTGTVVAPTLVLTAGHCAENLSTGATDAATGFHVLIAGGAAAGAEAQIASVSGVIVYERFSRRTDNGDAALLVLSAPTAAPPVTLATAADRGAVRAGVTATIAGWGVTRFDQRHLTETLGLADTVVQGSHWCVREAPPFFARREICTIDPPGYATGACHGDSGGPLLAPVGAGGELVEIGITVHGYGRCSTRFPSVFTSVAPIASWVQTWVAAYRQPPAPAPPAPAPPAPPAQ